MIEDNKAVIILGAGIAGLGVGHTLRPNNKNVIVFEKQDDCGGLCNNLKIGNFIFEKFIYLSFSNIDYVNNVF